MRTRRAFSAYGSRKGADVRVEALDRPANRQHEKIGVFFSRIRGEIFLTEVDLEYMMAQQSELALVVAGAQAGFFVPAAPMDLFNPCEATRSFHCPRHCPCQRSGCLPVTCR